MVRKALVPSPESKFLQVRCADCSNEQILFSKPASHVTCQVCGATMANPTGGKAVIRGEIAGVLD